MKKLLWIFVIVFILLAVFLLLGMMQENQQAENLAEDYVFSQTEVK